MKKCHKFDHIIHITDYMDFRCIRCGCQFTKLALIRSLQFRFGDRWNIEYENLKEWKRKMRKLRNKKIKPKYIIIIYVYPNIGF